MAIADDGEAADLAARRIPGATAAEALDRMISAERDSGGIGTEEARRFHDQVTRTVAAAPGPDADHLATPRPDRHPSWNADVTPEARWRDTVTAVAGTAVTADARWPALAAALDRAVATGWDWATELSQLTSSPLPERAAANELYYRLLDAHPAAALTPSMTTRGDHGAPPPGPAAHHPPPTPAPTSTVDGGSPGR